jgi:hypothetical protein
MFGGAHFRPYNRASIRLRLAVFLGPPNHERKRNYTLRSTSVTGLLVVPVAVSLFSDDILKFVPAKPQQGHHLSISTMRKAGELAA